jgi:methylthioribose-1-phosphate isomerase
VIVNGRHYRTVWQENSGNTVAMIDQNKLPFSFGMVRFKSSKETAESIRNMTVRGAGAIGATAGFAMAQAFAEAPQGSEGAMWKHAGLMRKAICETRPTAVNLFHAVDRVFARAEEAANPKRAALQEAQAIADEDALAGEKIGKYGEKLVKNNARVQTHCNAGWLAFVDWGSALAPIYAAKRRGKKVFVRVDETRPRGQGARLTAWELANENVPHAIQADNAAAFYMAQGKTDLVIVGADRIASNGDFANKIGTLQLAICAKWFKVPFYVAAPTSTIDFKTPSGKGIEIEERGEDEVLFQSALLKSGKVEKARVSNPGSKASNPAFDVTPAKLVSGFITEKGIFASGKLGKLKARGKT